MLFFSNIDATYELESHTWHDIITWGEKNKLNVNLAIIKTRALWQISNKYFTSDPDITYVGQKIGKIT